MLGLQCFKYAAIYAFIKSFLKKSGKQETSYRTVIGMTMWM
jgi:hypothetical protein